MDTSSLVYGLWAVSTGLALAGGWACYYQLRQRDRHIDSLLRILQSIPEQTEVEAQALGLCQACASETGAQGVSLYLQPGGEESGFRRAAQTGVSAEATLGTFTISGPSETSMVTVSPRGSSLPPAGSWEITLPSATSSL